MASRKTVVAFDLYGTLLSTESIAEELANHYGEDNAKPLATLWRRYQLEYTWRINSMGKRIQTIQRADARRPSPRGCGARPRAPVPETAHALMRSYDALRAFPEVGSALDHLLLDSGGGKKVEAYVFSNGTAEMVANSVRSSPDLGPRADRLFRALVTVDDDEGPRCYKPDRRVYSHLMRHAGVEEGREGDVWVVSANPFDIVGARAAGLNAAFIDRAGKGWIDHLDEARVPSVVARGVDEAVRSILKKT
ncbi:hypothetical protein DL766_008383 [Monosporascus sp. MC13-8B]|uniref:Haloacid dehalogenase n=1 Tax=Monosporascus cannonballus TaxID=155416 RepID=A0ABY0H8D2_9PEZI|nr:hypothetical protein DL762_004246 [Monosporascus cannonballus]RYP00634.1 hypothetical protein DL763_000688 [Monosporascus cannonballus]RYP19705.1 hypothetical protein DL766_008383 [Monosporascus sp. MC13-8B]